MMEPTRTTKTEAIKVGVRLRPFVAHETGQKKCLLIKGNVVSIAGDVAGKESKREYAVDVAMDSTEPSSRDYCSQEKCYKLMAQPLVDSILRGYNVCLFAYGQTGTGKTTTIMGKVDSPTEQGILVRMLRDIVMATKESSKKQGTKTQIAVEMIEIYNEKIKDLLVTPKAPHASAVPPDVRVHPKIGAYMTGVTQELVDSLEACVKLIEYGNAMKTVAATAMNSKSSRAHTIFRLKMEKRGGSDNAIVVSEVYFVDLAGRENEKSTKVTGDRLVELSFINRSLMWLSQCIQSLGQGGKRSSAGSSNESDKEQPAAVAAKRAPQRRAQTYAGEAQAEEDMKKALGDTAMPRKTLTATGHMAKFRNSKLTLLLMNALSGNSKTAMIGTLSPAAANFEESMSTLNFAATVKNIKLDATPASEIDKDNLVKTLKDEVEELKSQLAFAKRKELPRLSMKLDGTQSLLAQFEKDWSADTKERSQSQLEREEMLTQLTARSHPKAPYLANFNEDPYLCGRFVFQIAESAHDYAIGHTSSCDFKVPRGVGVQEVVGYIRKDHGEVVLRAASLPNGDLASLEVNSKRVGKEPVVLQHQDCLIFGSSLVYYIFTRNDGGIQNLPLEKQKFVRSSSKEGNSESCISGIIGDDPVPEQQTRAKIYLEHMEAMNRDAESAQVLREFLMKSERATRMVKEANDITAALRKNSGISFELAATAPVLAMGYGSQGMPQLSVRVVRQVDQEAARRRATSERERRKSVHADVAIMKSFEGGSTDSGKVDVLYLWTFSKFQERLQLMQDAYEAWTQDPADFVLDPLTDPWRDYGLGEVTQLKENYEQKAGELSDKLVKRKSVDIRRRTLTFAASAVHSASSTATTPPPVPHNRPQSCLKPSGSATWAPPPMNTSGKPKDQLLQVIVNLKATLEHFL